jgi:hypothetical protein
MGSEKYWKKLCLGSCWVTVRTWPLFLPAFDFCFFFVSFMHKFIVGFQSISAIEKVDKTEI